MVVNSDVEKTRLIDQLTAALAAAQALRLDLVVYLVETALAEAKVAVGQPKRRI